MSQVKLSDGYIKDRVKLALNEDLYPYGDITTRLVKNNKHIKFKLISNHNSIIAGILFAKFAFEIIDKKTKFIIKKKKMDLP